jgi:hypothetical protein
VFCEEEPDAELLCPKEKAWPDETFFLGEASTEEPFSPPVLLGALNEECDKSFVAGKGLDVPLSETLLIHIELLTFTENCSPCSPVLVTSLPDEAHIEMTAAHKYVMRVLKPLATLDNCPIAGACSYTAETVNIDLSDSEGYILALAENEELKRHAGGIFCPSSGEWDAHYLLLPSDGHTGEHLGGAWLALLDLHE